MSASRKVTVSGIIYDGTKNNAVGPIAVSELRSKQFLDEVKSCVVTFLHAGMRLDEVDEARRLLKLPGSSEGVALAMEVLHSDTDHPCFKPIGKIVNAFCDRKDRVHVTVELDGYIADIIKSSNYEFSLSHIPGINGARNTQVELGVTIKGRRPGCHILSFEETAETYQKKQMAESEPKPADQPAQDAPAANPKPRGPDGKYVPDHSQSQEQILSQIMAKATKDLNSSEKEFLAKAFKATADQAKVLENDLAKALEEKKKLAAEVEANAKLVETNKKLHLAQLKEAYAAARKRKASAVEATDQDFDDAVGVVGRNPIMQEIVAYSLAMHDKEAYPSASGTSDSTGTGQINWVELMFGRVQDQSIKSFSDVQPDRATKRQRTSDPEEGEDDSPSFLAAMCKNILGPMPAPKK